MSDQEPKKPTTNSKSVSRREFLKVGAAAAAGTLLAGAGSTIAKAATETTRRSAPAFLQGAKKEIKLLTWFWTEPGRNTAWRTMISKFHAAQNDIHINESGYGENDYFSTILVQAKSGQIDGDLFCE